MAETHGAARRHLAGGHGAGRRPGVWPAYIEPDREFSGDGEWVDQLSRPWRGRCGVSKPAEAGISPRYVAILGRDGLPGGGFDGRLRLELGGFQTDRPRHSLLGEHMSLVEQAIARMRNQARSAAPKTAQAGPTPAAPPIVDKVAEPA